MTFCFDSVTGVGICQRDMTAGYDASVGIPAGAITLDVDQTTNAALVADFLYQHDQYIYAGGVLSKNGVTISIAADGATKTTLDNMMNNADNAVSTNQTNIAANNTYLGIADTATATQVRTQVKALTQQNNTMMQQINTIIKRLKLLNRFTD